MITERTVNRLAADYRLTPQARRLSYLEHAQEHFLKWMDEQELFTRELGTAFKGGTAIRKFHLGHRGRFSTDLDFAIADIAVAKHVLDALAVGFECEGVRFALVGHPIADAGETHARWVASVPTVTALGQTIDAKLDFSLHDVLLPYEQHARVAINTIDSQTVGFAPVCPPLVDLRENVAEKLARLRRRPLARDVFDLTSLATRVRAEMPLIRELVFLKVYEDVAIMAKGNRPFGGGAEYKAQTPEQIEAKEELGTLSQPQVDWRGLLRTIATVYGDGIGDARDARERKLAACLAADRYWYSLEIEAFRARHRS